MTTKTQTPPKAAPKRDRSGYYTHPGTGERFMSVTTILTGGIPKPALMHWASFEAAQCAVDNIPALVKARGEGARREMRTWIQHAAERKRDTAANLGTTVHGFLESQILGEPTPDYTDQERLFIDAFGRFLDAYQPKFEAAELTVANLDHHYAGTLDAIASIPSLVDGLIMLDWKTGKSIYPEVGLQLGAYRRCSLGWMKKDGTEVEVPQTVEAMVLHLRPESMPGGEPGGYALRPVRSDDPVFELFLAAKTIAEAARKEALFDQIVGETFQPLVEAVA